MNLCIEKIKQLETDKKELLDNNKSISQGMAGSLITESNKNFELKYRTEEAEKKVDEYK